MLRILAVAATALTFAQGANAATITFNSLASYNSGVGPSTVAENFTGNQLNGTAISQITGSFLYGSNKLLRIGGNNQGPQFTTLTFSTAMTAFAANIGSLGINEQASVLLDGVLATIIPGGSGFFGLHSTKSFTSITFLDATFPSVNTQFNLDDIRVSAVPLPAALPMLIAGLGGLIGFKRRKQRVA
jgi:hypothetical protein